MQKAEKKNRVGGNVIAFLVIVIFFTFGLRLDAECGTKKVEISAGSLKGALFAFGTAWAKIVNRELKGEITATVVSTAGSLENLRLLANGKTDIGFVITPQAKEAYDGRGIFKKPAKNLRTILTYHYGGLQFVVRADSEIRTIGALKGKKVTVGAPGSAGAIYNAKALEAHGLTPKDYDRQMLPYSAGVRAIKDGVVDCFAIFAPAPIGIVMEIASTHKIRILPFERMAIDKFCKENPGFEPGYFKKGSYKNMVNTEDVPTVMTTISILSREGVDEDIIYKMTKVLFDNIAEFHLCHKTAKNVVLSEALKGSSIPLHPGALRFYEEKGLKIRPDLIP